MEDGIKITDLLDLKETIAAEIFNVCEYPWEVLPKINTLILNLGATLSQHEYEHTAHDVWISKTATVYSSAYINGPCIIGHHAQVRHCAFIRGSAIVGEYAVVGNSTELRNVILFNHVQVVRPRIAARGVLREEAACLRVVVPCIHVLQAGGCIGDRTDEFHLVFKVAVAFAGRFPESVVLISRSICAAWGTIVLRYNGG